MIVGAGSGNMLPADGSGRAPDRHRRERSLRRHVPQPRLHPVEDARLHRRCRAVGAAHAGRYGIDAQLRRADWPAIRERVFSRIDPLPGARSPTAAGPASTSTWAHARFVGAAGGRGRRRGSARRARCRRRRITAAYPDDSWSRVGAVPHLRHHDARRRVAGVDGRARWWVRRRGDEPHVRITRHRDHHREPRSHDAGAPRRRHPASFTDGTANGSTCGSTPT